MSISGPTYIATCETCGDSVTLRARSIYDMCAQLTHEGWFCDHYTKYPKTYCSECAETARKAAEIRRGIE